MLTGSTLVRALKAIVENGEVVLRDISSAVQVSDLAESLGRPVLLVQDSDRWELGLGEESDAEDEQDS